MKKLQFYFFLSVGVLKRSKRKLHYFIYRLRNFPNLKLLIYNRKFLISLGIILFVIAVSWKITLGRIYDHTISEGIVGVYTQENLPLFVSQLISDPLVKLDQSGKPQAALAESWTSNQDATEYTFKLRSNVFWSDGTVLKSKDISFNQPGVQASYPDDHTIVFKLSEAYSPFPTLLTEPVFKKNSLIGVGKYQISQVDYNRTILTKLKLHPRESNLPTMTIRFYPDDNTAKTAFQLGEVESLIGVTEGMDTKQFPLIRSRKLASDNKITAIFYNTKDPILSDKNFRKALNYAVPKISGEELAETSYSSRSWVFNEQIKDHFENIELAQSYLNKVKNGKDSTITLTVTPILVPLGERIVSNWKKMGVNAVLRTESGIPQNFQALLLTESLPQDPDQYVLWHSSQTRTNISKIDNKRIDKDLEDGRRLIDASQRREKYLDFQKVLADESPASFLYFPKPTIYYLKRAEKELNSVLPLQI